VLEEALAIGRQADAPATENVRTRLEGVQTGAPTLNSVPDSPVFAKIKSWFERKTQTETS
jgi:hypothetical protein